MRLCVFSAALSLLLLWALVAPSRTQSATPSILKVPADYPTVQGAINAAADGDTVLVSPGTYKENNDFVGRNITVKSQSGPEVTILDGNHSAPMFTFRCQS